SGTVPAVERAGPQAAAALRFDPATETSSEPDGSGRQTFCPIRPAARTSGLTAECRARPAATAHVRHARECGWTFPPGPRSAMTPASHEANRACPSGPAAPVLRER